MNSNNFPWRWIYRNNSRRLLNRWCCHNCLQPEETPTVRETNRDLIKSLTYIYMSRICWKMLLAPATSSSVLLGSELRTWLHLAHTFQYSAWRALPSSWFLDKRLLRIHAKNLHKIYLYLFICLARYIWFLQNIPSPMVGSPERNGKPTERQTFQRCWSSHRWNTTKTDHFL